MQKEFGELHKNTGLFTCRAAGLDMLHCYCRADQEGEGSAFF